MSRIRLHIDEDAMQTHLTNALRARGVDVATAFERQLVGISDEDQLLAATADARAIYSFNIKDFRHLHEEWVTSGREHAGIIVGFQRYTVGEQLRRILHILSKIDSNGIRSRFIYLSDWSTDL